MKRALLLLLALLWLPAGAKAQTLPVATNYVLKLKGVLLPFNKSTTSPDPDESRPQADGDVSCIFKLYDTADKSNGVAPLITETQTVTVKTDPSPVFGEPARHGKYSVTLGSSSGTLIPASLFRTKTLYLEIWIGGAPPPAARPRTQILQIPNESVTVKSMNQVIWVTNALDHIESAHALETAALAFYINRIYSGDSTHAGLPNADPNFVVRSLIRAEDTFNQKYRDARTGNFRVTTNPLDAVVNMYGTLVQQPGNPVTQQIIGESLTFAAGTLNLTGSDSSQRYKQFSYELGRMSAVANFNDYTARQLESLYLLARNNPRAAIVVNTFFGYGFRSNVTDNLFTVLNKNPDLYNSQNFAPLRDQIETDGTMLSTLDTTLANLADFYDRMTVATKTAAAALADITAKQKNDYVGAINNSQTAQSVKDSFTVANATVAPALQSATAANYATSVITLKSDAAYNGLSIALATTQLASAVAQTVADGVKAAVDIEALDPGDAANATIQLPVDACNVASATLNVALQSVTSPSDVIKQGISDVSDQLNKVQTQLNGRLDIIDQNIAKLYTQMDADFKNLQQALVNGLGNISNQVDNLVTDVVRVQYTLDRLTQSFSTFETISSRQTGLIPYLTVINNWADPGTPAPSSDTWLDKFSACETYATSACTSQLENGNKSYDGFSSSYADTDIVSQLDSSQEKNLNYLLAFALHRFFYRDGSSGDLDYTPPANFTVLQNEVANPVGWEMSCLGMMRAATLFPAYAQSHIQAESSGFAAAYNIGAGIQAASTAIALQYHDSSHTLIEPSPLLANMMLHEKKMATNLYAALVAAENGATDTATQVANIKLAYANSNSPVTLATTALNGSRRLLEQYIEFGLSRSAKSNQTLNVLLYASGDGAFRDPTKTSAKDPNAQQLPDGSWVQSQYNSWVPSIAAAPNAPTLSASGTGNTLPSATYYVVVAAVDSTGRESALSAEALQAVTLGQKLVVTPPALASGLKYNVYVGTASGGPYYLQNVDTQSNAAPITGGVVYNQTAPAADARTGGQLYHQFVTGDPLAKFTAAQDARWKQMELLLDGNVWASGPTDPKFPNAPTRTGVIGTDVLHMLAANANFNQSLLGEPLVTVDAIESRMAFFLIPTVSGTLSAKPVNPLTGPQPKSLANTVVTMKFRGIKAADNFDAPVLLDANANFLIYVPADQYTVQVKADSFLQGYIQAPGQAIVNTGTGSVTNAVATSPGPNNSRLAGLLIGDVTGDNVVDNSDMIAVRNALGSQLASPLWVASYDFNGDSLIDNKDAQLLIAQIGIPSSDINWDARYDLNGDGVVDYKDQKLLMGALNSTSASSDLRWNPLCDFNNDGKVDYADQEIFKKALGSKPGSRNWNPICDINHDGVVDYKDQMILQGRIGARPSSANWNPVADLNGDGVVDTIDLLMLRANWGVFGVNN